MCRWLERGVYSVGKATKEGTMGPGCGSKELEDTGQGVHVCYNRVRISDSHCGAEKQKAP